ncbi:GTPase domain-containing protein [Micromonospora sp. KC723]|uniref:DUF697 domain-containing protein n=1 Tax=Micromonospora sp. KC723 TaxID=2530381 RepID=UPI001A9F4D2C|nr:GTPase domain-containing protein [Micromonospora sp. KC723]
MTPAGADGAFDRFMAAALRAYEEQLREIGRFNLAVFGDTGVGKSTLINSVFGVELAKAGRGDSQTVRLQRHSRTPDDPLTIYDNAGFDTGDGSIDDLVRRIDTVVTGLRQGPPQDWIHVVWYVHNALTNRFTSHHAALLRAVHDMGLPVMLVLTHVPRLGDEVSPAVVELADRIAALDLPLAPDGRIFLVNSVEMPQLGGATIPRHGLDDLLRATIELVPDAANAIRAVQRLHLAVQRREAVRLLRRYRRIAAGAGAAAGAPVPAVDLLGLGATLAAMIGKISAVYAVPLNKQQLTKVAAVAAIGVTGVHGGALQATSAVARQAGKRIAARQAGKEVAKAGARQVGRYLPGVNVAIGAAGAVSAAGLTTAAAHAWMRVCEYLLARPRLLRAADDTSLLDLFHQFYQLRGSTPPAE